MIKIVRTDRELECPIIDAALRKAGADLVLLPDGVGEGDLTDAVRDADLRRVLGFQRPKWETPGTVSGHAGTA